MLVCTLGGKGGRGSEKVYCLYTHENVDIFGWPLTVSTLKLAEQGFSIPEWLEVRQCPYLDQSWDIEQSSYSSWLLLSLCH